MNRLRRSLARLNEVALAADDQLSMLYPVRSVPLRLHLMDLELAAARLASAPLDGMKLGGNGDPIRTRRDAARLQLHARRLRLGRWTARHMRLSTIESVSEIGAGLADIARAAAAFGQVAAELPVHAKPQPVPKAVPGPLAWRVALRVTLASAISMAGGMALSPQRWFWAVITTYVVFLGTRSRGDTLYKGVQRLGGTLLGLVAGLSLAAALEGNGPAEAVTLLAATFGMYYLFLVSYTLGIFFVTVLLGLIYSLLGAVDCAAAGAAAGGDRDRRRVCRGRRRPRAARTDAGPGGPIGHRGAAGAGGCGRRLPPRPGRGARRLPGAGNAHRRSPG